MNDARRKAITEIIHNLHELRENIEQVKEKSKMTTTAKLVAIARNAPCLAHQ